MARPTLEPPPVTPSPAAPAADRPRWLSAFWPAPTAVNARERLRVVVGAALGIFITAFVARELGSPFGHVWPWLVPPLGASAVLVFGVPGSPLAQPWSVVGGNTVSALAGIACVHWLGTPMLAAPMAVGSAIALMFALRCLHPPGGAAALVVSLGSITDPRFALDPILLNSLLLAASGIVYNTLTGRAYPHRQAKPAAAPGANADLDTVIARYNQVLDISRDDLQALLEDAQLQGYQRRLADLRCAEIMSPRPVTVTPETTIAQAWRLFREHRIKALPVVGAGGAVVGIVTPADFMREAEDARDDSHDERRRRMRSWSRAAPGVPIDTVARIMTRRVRVTSVGSHLSDLVPLFASTGHHHLPVVDEAQRLVGIITQSDVVAALVRSSQPERTAATA